jgi:hypothetical protein
LVVANEGIRYDVPMQIHRDSSADEIGKEELMRAMLRVLVVTLRTIAFASVAAAAAP